jgi:TonB family protein
VQLLKASLFLSLFLSTPLHAKRVALVMGNDNYTVVNKLQKAGNDAKAMERELKKAGFTVQLHRDLNYRSMVKAIETFANGITGGDEVVVFYAGHGVQIRSGSYLLPIDIEATSESEVEKTAYELLALTDKISEAKPAFTLIMVDACRDNPLKAKGRSVGNSRGMSAIEPPKGQMVVYSASRGQQALDRLSEKDPNPNGVFTREFLARMNKPGIKIEDLLKDVQDSVETLAKTVNHEQRPAVYNESRGNFYFFGPVTVQSISNNSVDQKDEKFWEDAKAAGNKEAYEAYLLSFPNGQFANLARANLARLSKVAETVSKPNTAEPAKPVPTQAPQINADIWRKPLPSSADSETIQLYKEAVERNDAASQVALGYLFEIGRGGLAKDDGDAGKLYKISASQGNARAQNNLAVFHRDGRGGFVRNDIEAERLFRLSANQGNPVAQNNLGTFYRDGRGGLAKDEAEALKLFRLSASQGLSYGQWNLAIFHELGQGGLAKNDLEALRLYRLSANQSYSPAQNNLAIFHRDGRAGLLKNEIEAERLFRMSADQGYPGAQHNLGVFYRDGRGGLVKDEVEALRLFRSAVAQGDAAAQNSLALFYRNGHAGLAKNDEEAVRLFNLSTAQGYSIAQYNLGRLYDYGLAGLPKDETQALRLYKLAAAQGHSNAISRLKEINSAGLNTTPIWKNIPQTADSKTREIFQLATEKNDASSQVRIANDYKYGRNSLPIDEFEAQKFYRFASAQGNSEAQVALGWFYRDGRGGLEKNDLEAERLFKLAAAQSNAGALHSLAFLYSNSNVITRDYVEALRLHQIAATQGEFNSLYYLGVFNEQGLGGLKKDEVEAVKWYRLSADKGHSGALAALGGYFEKGRGGIKRNDIEAEKLYRLSSMKGNSQGQFSLAQFYENGRGGLSIDLAEAMRLYKLAADQGNSNAKNRIKEIDTKKVEPKITTSEEKIESAVATALSRTKIRTESCQSPVYPATSKQKKEEGAVTLKFFVDSDGRLVKHEVSKSSGFVKLDKAAESTLSTCKFFPATVDGKNTDGWAEITYTWKLS